MTSLDSKDFCTTNPKPCRKKLNINRKKMPQIDTSSDYKNFKNIIKKKLSLTFEEKPLQISSSNIYISQKHVNLYIAEAIANKIKKKKSKSFSIPIILLKNNKNEYMIVDGHHRWLAYHQYLKKEKANVCIVHIGDLNLKKGFQKIKNKLPKKLFKGYSLNGKTKKHTKKQNKRKTRKRH